MNLQDAIKQGKAQRVAVSILDAGGQVHEKYVISVKVISVVVARLTRFTRTRATRSSSELDHVPVKQYSDETG